MARRQDSVILLVCDRPGTIAQAINQLRAQYLASGLPWNPKSSDNAESKAVQRLPKKLAADGLTVLYTKTVKTTRVRLTPAGDACARALA